MLSVLRRRRLAAVSLPVLAATVAVGVLGTAGVTAAAAPALTTVFINTGGPALTDVDGNKWVADTYAVGGRVSASSVATKNTRKTYVFKDDRYAMSAYRIPVVNGTYDVQLLEAEQYFDAPGKRVFDVKAEGDSVARNVDIFARAGAMYRAIWIEFRTTVTDGVLDLDFTATVNHPKVNGITVQPAPVQSTSPSPSASPAPTSSTAPAPAPAPEPPPAPSPEPTSTATVPAPEPSGSTVEPTPTATAPGRDPVLWGMDDDAEFDAAEAETGRRFALARQYRRIDQSFVSSRGQTLVKGGRSLVVSVRARTSTAYVKYADITAGKYDAAFANGLRQLDALATPSWFIFQHEADSSAAKASCVNQTDAGCGPEFVAAWRHIHSLAKANGISSKVRFTWTVTGYGFNPQTKVRNNHYWPGAAYTDWLGVDAYNGGCNESWYGTFAQMLDYTLGWAKQNVPTMPIILPEWGATEGATSSAKAEFFKGVPGALTSPGFENVKAILYWNQAESGCDFRYTSSSASRAAFTELAKIPLVSAMP